jgi:hypothetical protein
MRTAVETQVVLRNGCWHGEACHREVRVRAIAEDDAALVDELSSTALPLERDTLLLARCVTGLERGDGPRMQCVRDLSLGDREALLLHARRLTFGGQIDCVLPCPECHERTDLQLHVDQLLLPVAAGEPKRYFEETMVADGVRFRVQFRIPSAADLEEALSDSNRVCSDAVQVVLYRSVEWVRLQSEESELANENALPLDAWPADLMTRISERMEELDPQAEINLNLTCPACQHCFTTVLDIGDYLLRELTAREQRRYQEVHQLALAYHWSEADILNMSQRRRQLYLNLLSESSGE